MSEDEKIIEYIKKEYGNYDNYVRDLLDLYQKEKEKNKELERKWDEEKYLIKLAENELLGYIKGYEDGYNHNSTAVQQVIKGRESEIHQLERERLKKIISKLEIEIEKEKERNKQLLNSKVRVDLSFDDYISKDKIRKCIQTPYPEVAVENIVELLEENNDK